jgi:hypothetical protein
LSLFGVGESLIGVGDFFEFVGVASFIGVFLESFSSECFSDLFGSSLFVDTKKFIVLCGVDLFFLLGCLLFTGHTAAKAGESSKASKSS